MFVCLFVFLVMHLQQCAHFCYCAIIIQKSKEQQWEKHPAHMQNIGLWGFLFCFFWCIHNLVVKMRLKLDIACDTKAYYL